MGKKVDRTFPAVRKTILVTDWAIVQFNGSKCEWKSKENLPEVFSPLLFGQFYWKSNHSYNYRISHKLFIKKTAVLNLKKKKNCNECILDFTLVVKWQNPIPNEYSTLVLPKYPPGKSMLKLRNDMRWVSKLAIKSSQLTYFLFYYCYLCKQSVH